MEKAKREYLFGWPGDLDGAEEFSELISRQFEY